MNDKTSSDDPASPAISRRDFLALGCTAAAGAAAAHWLPAAIAAAPPAGGHPVMEIARLDALKEGEPVAFTYPDSSSPAMLLRLPAPAQGGVGPDNRVVAFSTLCTHKGCPVAYRPERQLMICPCHWSSFDPAKAGQMVIGQASQALPQIELKVEGGMVKAVGIRGLIYGRHTNIL
jgi:arsenite oxidase small subunit